MPQSTLLGMNQTRRFPDFERRRADAEARARRATTVLLLDEIHYLDDWASNSKGIGTTCVERLFQSTSLQRAHPHCG